MRSVLGRRQWACIPEMKVRGDGILLNPACIMYILYVVNRGVTLLIWVWKSQTQCSCF